MLAKAFEEQAAKYAQGTAVKTAERELTFDSLNKYANRIARKILEKTNARERLTQKEVSRYKRQMLIDGWDIEAQEKLKAATVFVAGAGGSGSPLIIQLALCGVGNIIVCDFDEIEMSNLNRQCLHNESRIGMNKAISAQMSIAELNPDVNVIAHTEKITRDNVFKLVGDSAIIFDNVDDLETKFILSECAVEKQILHIISSMIDINSYVAIFHTPYTPCFHCLYDRDKLQEIKEIRSVVKDYRKMPNPVASPSLFLSTGFACNEAIKIILGFPNPAYNKYFLFNQKGSTEIANTNGHLIITYPFSEHFRSECKEQGFDWDVGWRGNFLEELNISHNPDCPVCGGKHEAVAGEGSAKHEVQGDAFPSSAEVQNVALLFEQGEDMIAGVIGALKAGKTYVPFDPAYPEQRLLHMLEDSEAELLVTNNRNIELAKRLVFGMGNQIKLLNIDTIAASVSCENIKREALSCAAAYLLYTSGSTGKPKGVVQTHENVLHFAKSYIKNLSLSRNDRLTLLSTFGHDAAVIDIFSGLLSGAALYPLSIREQENISKLSDWLIAEKITVWHSVPTLYRYFANTLEDSLDFPMLRYVVLGGENVIENDVELYKRHFGGAVLVNLYGQSESSYNSSLFITSDIDFESVSLGEPVLETEIFVLNEAGKKVSTFRTGEIVIASKYLAKGYWKDEEKTRKVFTENPELGSLYWTGDMGRLLDDGSIEFMGRKDFQVKVRGFRVELGEIESCLLRHESIRETVVLGRDNDQGETYLTAYVVSDREFAPQELREYLGRELPDHMIPLYFIRMDKMPLLPNGKLDRKAFANLAGQPEYGHSLVSRTAYEAPGDETERKLALIWSEVLCIEKIGVNHNFFELGGHSLKATSLISKIHKELNVEVPLREVFRTPTIKGLAEYISVQEENIYESIEAVEEREYYELSPAQNRLYILQQLDTEGIGYNISGVLEAEGKLDAARLEEAFKKLIQRHESLRTSFDTAGEEIVQKIHKQVEFEIEHYEANEDEIETIIKEFIKPFDLSKAPLLRVGLIALPDEEQLCEEKHILMYDMHHIISDGTSMGILMDEFVKLYEGKELKELKIQYKDYAEWQNREENAIRLEEQGKYWLPIFGDSVPSLNMPLDYPRKDIQTFWGNTINFEIKSVLFPKIRAKAQQEGMTVNAMLLSFYSILLSKYAGQEDVVIGSTVANRNHLELEHLIGAFINFIPIKVKVNGNMSINEFLRTQKNIIEEAYNNQEYPFDKLVENLKIRSNNRNQIFDTMLIFHNEIDGYSNISIDGLKFTQYQLEKQISTLDFKLDIYLGEKENLNCYLQYNKDLYKKESMIRLARHFELLLEKYFENEEANIYELDIFTENEKEEIESKRERNNCDKPSVELAVAATFTSDPIADYVKWWCEKFGKKVDVKISGYNQVFQELLNPESSLSKNKSINLIMVRFEDWIRDIRENDELKCEVLQRNYNNLLDILKNWNISIPAIIGVFPVSAHLNLSHEIIECIEALNRNWIEAIGKISNISIIDFNEASELYGIQEVFDPIKDKAGHVPFSDEYFAAIGTMIARRICAIRHNPFKVIAVDCDNTLWKGICGEVGPSGVGLEESYLELQRLLVKKHDEGMLVVLCSKNNEADVWEVFEQNQQIILKREHIANWSINWGSKSENIRALAKELNVGIDSFIFIDDSAIECCEMMKNNPQVLTLQLPEDSEQIPRYLKHIWAFDKIKVTEEDRVRTKYYQLERQRKEIQNTSMTIESFLKELDLSLVMREAEKEQIPRVSQLTQRTNQFNLSTIRRTEEEIERLLQKPNMKCWVVEVEDKFGDYGLSGAIFTQNSGEKLFIDTFLLSCRVLGRSIEDALLVELGKYCRKQGIKKIEADFYPTGKNQPIQEFLLKTKWNAAEESEKYIKYEIEVEGMPESNDLVKCYHEKQYKKAEEDITPLHAGVREIHNSLYSSVSQKNMIPGTMNWKVNVENEEELLHANYLMPLRHYTGEMLLELPVFENEANNLSTQVYEAPRNEVEEKLVKLWQKILGVQRVGINDSFFELGGHSLKAINLTSRIHKEFNVEVSLKEVFGAPTVKGLAEYIKAADQNIYSSIEPVDEREYYPASSAQKRIYTLQQFETDGVSYNIPGVMTIEGELDRERLEAAFEKLVERHEGLRTSFEIADGEILQKINKQVDFKVEYKEVEEGEVKEAARELIRPFDLSKAPLIRGGLIRHTENKHTLVFDMHHIISDGVSVRILTREFVELYKGKELPALRLQYKDFSAWQNGLFREERIKQQEEYWLDRFRGEIPMLNLPSDYLRPSIQSFEGEMISFRADKELETKLKKLTKETGTTLYMVLLSAYNVLLGKYSGQEDIIVGSPVAGRPHADLENIIGMFVNTLAMRNFPEGSKTFREFLEEVKQNSLEAYQNQDYQFEELVERLEVRRDISRNPLFDVMLAVQNTGELEASIEGLKFMPESYRSGVSQFDLSLTAEETEEGISFGMEYCTKLFDRDTIERMTVHFLNIIREAAANPEIRLSEIELLTEEEKRQLLYDFNDTDAEYPKDKTLHELFEEQAARTPENIALVHNNRRMTYRELNERANNLAAVIRSKGVKADDIVGLMVARSPEMMISIFAILKAGGAYLPIDREYPAERIEYMLEDSGAAILLTQADFADRIKYSGEIVDIYDESIYAGAGNSIESASRPDNLAYIIYTSGTTGKPKGVAIEHRNIVNFVLAFKNTVSIGGKDAIFQQGSYCFDAFAEEAYPVLISGGKMVIVNKHEVLDGPKLRRLSLENKVSIVSCTPPVLCELNKLPDTGCINKIICGSDVVKGEYAAKILLSVSLYNGYGPTEATVGSMYYKCENRPYSNIPIGKPIPNYKAYILGKNNSLQPVGVPGELCIAGEGLARGYLNRPELTAEKFVDNPFMPGKKMYRTGDLAKWLPDGNIEFLGRIDYQVKIRGYRIELGEIESRLMEYEGVKEAVVTARDDKSGNKYLCAYIVADREMGAAELREHLLTELPDYMIPSYFVQLDKLPLAPSGKIDRKSLPEPDYDIVTGTEYEAPGNETEEKLVKLWQDILGVQRVGINDSFFELGGHSLKAVNLTSRIHKEFNVEVPLKEVFGAPTVKGLAEYIKAAEGNIYSSIEPVEEREYYPASSAQKRIYTLQQFETDGVSYNIPGVMVIEGELDRKRLEAAFEKLVERHEGLRTSFEIANGEILQKINKQVDFKVEYEETEEEGAEKAAKELIKPFDLSKAPLIRVGLMRHTENKHTLVFDMHHIISDGVSVNILTREFVELYKGEELPALRLQYKDFSLWQNELIKGERIKQQEEYWLDRFRGEIPMLNLPSDYPRPSIQSFEGELISFRADKELETKLKKLIKETGTTLYMVLLSAYNVLLGRYSGQEDIIVGSPVAGRPHADLENIIGMFVNTLAMRNFPEGSKTFREFLEEVKLNSLGAYQNQDYQFEELVEGLEVRRDMSRNPLFDVMLAVQNTGEPEASIEGLKFIPESYRSGISKFDLTLTAEETEEGISFGMEYCTKLFERETIERMTVHFLNIIREAAANPEIRLSEIELLTEEEKRELLYDFNDTDAEYPKDKTLHELFEEQAARTPGNIALVHNNRHIIYRELNERANNLAAVIKGKGVKADDIVGLMVARSPEMIVGILGILKAGGAYLPIDPEYPAERIEYMLEDSGAGVLLTQADFADRIKYSGEIVDIYDESIYAGAGNNIESASKPDNLAYIIYTSGTTGKPKGAMIEHRNVVRLMFNDRLQFDFSEKDTWTLFHSVCFDFSVWEMYGALLYGGKLVIVEKETAQATEEYLKLLKAQKVTVLNQTPTAFYKLAGEEIKQPGGELAVRYVIFGGEALKPATLNEWRKKYPDTKLINMYGITETTVHVTYKEITEKEISGGVSNIGSPIPTLKTYIMDKSMKLQPVGVPGELCVGGLGVCRGYLNKPALTKEKFVANPYNAGERLYRSGDLARLVPGGEMEYLGRIDQQVKIRGHRIELGEIENEILKHREIREAAVIDRPDDEGGRYLCAYIIADTELTMAEIREHLGRSLPEYMIPSYFIQLQRLPLTKNGKLDRKSLPEPDGNIKTGAVYEAPRNETEKKLVELWQEVLNVGEIGINDSFFELGGHSLKATVLTSRIHEELNIRIPLKVVFGTPTIKGLYQHILTAEKELYLSIEPVEAMEYYPVSSAQKRVYLINEFNKLDTSYNIPYITVIEGYIDRNKFEKVIGTLLQRHEIFRTFFEVVKGEVVQKVAQNVEAFISYQEAEDFSENEIEAAVKAFIRPFELDKTPLMRAGLIKLSDTKHIMLLDMHHIVSDGITLNLLVDEFVRLYNRMELPALRLQYKDFALWQNSLIEQGKMAGQEQYWLGQFRDGIPVLDVPMDYRRPDMMTFEGSTIRFTIEETVVSRLNAMVKAQNTTLNVLMFSIYNILLQKYSGKQDIVVGSIAAGRRHPDLMNTAGLFTNYLPVRSRINPESSFLEFSEYMKDVLSNAFDNQDYPFDRLLEKLAVKRDSARNPLFDTMLVFHNEIDPDLGWEAEGLKFTQYALKNEASVLDFKLDIYRGSEGELRCGLQYNTNLFKEETIVKTAENFKALVEAVLSDPKTCIKDINVLGENEKQQLAVRENRTVKLAVSATFTAEPVDEYIKWWGNKFGMNIAVEFAPYNQVFQEMLSSESLLSANEGVNLIMVRFEDWIRDEQAADEVKCRKLDKNFGEFIEILKNKEKKIPYFVGVFPVSSHLSLSSTALKFIEEMNVRWRNELKAVENVYAIDFGTVAELYSIRSVFDPIKDKAGHVPFSDEFYAAMGTTIARKIYSWDKQHFKVIALDCDNTLWKGICGEDGAAGVSAAGPYSELQKFLIQKCNEGMLLTLCSKNNEKDVWEVFEKNTEMLLKKEHFVGWRINWKPKTDNIKELAEELNLGLDSFIFVDDSPMECAGMMTDCPEVLTLQLPEEPNHIPQYIRHVWAFDRFKVTEEDRKRTDMYKAEKQRKQAHSEIISMSNFLKELNLKVSMRPIEKPQIDRVAQLTQRTNQFNLSTIRRTEEQIERLTADGMKCWIIEVKDRFGDYGLVGTVIAKNEKEGLFVDTFLLSCRVLGRGVEHAVLSGLGQYCRENGLTYMEADFYPTAKNKPFSEFMKSGGWKAADETKNYAKYMLYVNEIPQTSVNIELYYHCSYEEETDKEDTGIAIRIDDIAVVAESESLYEIGSWNVNAVNSEKLLHRNHLLPLENHSGQLLLKLPVHEVKEGEFVREKYIAPRSSIEKRLELIWSDILGVRDIGINDDFFKIGGHSLKAVVLTSQIFKEFNVELTLKEVFENSTISVLAELIVQASVTGGSRNNAVEQSIILLNGRKDSNLFLFPPVIGYAISYKYMSNFLDSSAYALNFIEDKDRVSHYVNLIKAAQENGPYVLLGYSAGGNLMFEVAKELQARGEEVSDIIIMDTYKKIDRRILAEEVIKQSTERMASQMLSNNPLAKEYLNDELVLSSIFNKSDAYEAYTNDLVNTGELNANIHLIRAADGYVIPNTVDTRDEWRKSTTKKLIEHTGFGDHFKMIDPGNAEKNAGIINEIMCRR